MITDFYKIWVKDVLECPIKYLIKKNSIKTIKLRLREAIYSDTVFINIHEWGGYPLTRTKSINGINDFESGLYYQLIRFKQQKTDKKINISITISDIEKSKYLNEIKKYCHSIYSVSNIGMDFSGYSNFYDRIKDEPNAFAILTNSSVNCIQNDFLDSYISYMEQNPDVGILGISSCSGYYHTLLRRNYNPHLQSFFLLTTISVLKEIVQYNNDEFPGIKESNKHMLIRNGEVRLSNVALMLGYNLALVFENQVYKFNYNSYPLPRGDLRKYATNPNAITPIIDNIKE